MALPELFANNYATTLGTAIADGTTTTMTVAAGAPAALQGSGQFRVLVESEWMIVTAVGGSPFTSWTVTRGAEGSTAVAHANGVAVTHIVTSGAIGVLSDPVTATPGLRSLGSGAQQAMPGDTFTRAVSLTAAGTALSVTNNATIGGTLAVTGTATFGTYTGQSSIVTLGTITTGVWTGSVIAGAYIDTALARLASPTFTGTVTTSALTANGLLTAFGGVLGGSTGGQMQVGSWVTNTVYAAIAHSAVFGTSASYALLQDGTGETYVNSASGKTLHLRVANADVITVATGSVGVSAPLGASRLWVGADTGSSLSIALSGGPSFDMQDLAGALDAKRSRINNTAGVTAFQSVNDAYTAAYTALSFTNSATPAVTIPVNVTIGAAGSTAATGIGTNTGWLRVQGTSATDPRYQWLATDAGKDQGLWQAYATGTGNTLNFTAVNDAQNAETMWMQAVRGSGTAITSVTFPNAPLIADHQTSVASVTTARTGISSTAALPANPVKYLALRDETGARVYVPAYS